MKLLKIISVSSIILLTGLSIKAQQRQLFSTYMYNGLALNPAYAGSLNLFSAIFTNRNQWVNIKGAPEYQSLTAHSSFKDNQVGAGLNVVRDIIGIHEQYSLYGSGAYKIRMNKGILSMGLQAGFDQRTSDFNFLELFNEDDASLAGVQSSFNPNFGVGLYFANRDYFIGGSIPYILTPTIYEVVGTPTLSRSSRYYYINGGFVKDLTSNLKINPSALIRIQDDTPIAFDINANLIINEIVYAGLSYRFGVGDSFDNKIPIISDALSVMTQLILNENFRVAYAYDISINDLRGYTAGSHEIMLNYRIRLKLNKRDGLCPVYF